MVNSVTINNDSSLIQIVVTDLDFTNLLFWTHNSFKKASEAVNLASLIPTPINDTYVFDITPANVGLTSFAGIFFLEFSLEESTPLISVSNLSIYHECLLSKILNIKIENCKVVKTGCSDCEDSLFYASVLLDSLYVALNNAYYSEAVDIAKTLDELCEVCHSCPPKDNANINGYGFNYLTS